MTEKRKPKFKKSPCVGFLLDEKCSPMIDYLNFYSLLAFQNSKAEFCQRTKVASDLPAIGRERTFRKNVPLRDLVQCENEEECYALKKDLIEFINGIMNSIIVAKVVENDTHGRPKLEQPICREIIVEQYIIDEFGHVVDSVYRLFSIDCEFTNTYSRKTVNCATCTQCKKSHLQFLRRFQTWANREVKEPNRESNEESHLREAKEPNEESQLAWIDQQIMMRKKDLDANEVACFKSFLTRGHRNQVVINKFSIDMTVDKLCCLRNRVWLNDEVVNFYMCLLQVRSDRHLQLSKENPSYRPFQARSSHYFNSFFMSKILEHGRYQYALVKRWTKKFDIFEKEKIFFPLNISNTHWALLVLFVQLRQIHYLDSMSGRGKKYLDTILRWVVDEGMEKKKMDVDTSGWLLVDRYNTDEIKQILCANGNEQFFKANYSQKVFPAELHYVPQQNNGFDCGVFVCMNSDFITDDVPLLNTFSQQNMEHFRLKIGTDIIRGTLNYD